MITINCPTLHIHIIKLKYIVGIYKTKGSIHVDMLKSPPDFCFSFLNAVNDSWMMRKKRMCLSQTLSHPPVTIKHNRIMCSITLKAPVMYVQYNCCLTVLAVAYMAHSCDTAQWLMTWLCRLWWPQFNKYLPYLWIICLYRETILRPCMSTCYSLLPQTLPQWNTSCCDSQPPVMWTYSVNQRWFRNQDGPWWVSFLYTCHVGSSTAPPC